jgi:hypothetical protein
MTVTAESLFVPAAPSDRRVSQRYKPAQPVATMIGRGKGSLVDISATGARIRHTGAVARGAHVRVTFDWQGSRFEAAGAVLASRVAGISPEGTLFESRIHFRSLTEQASAVLESALDDLGSGDLRRWVANLHALSDEDAAPVSVAAPASAFIRCRFAGGRWEQRLAHDPALPADGFVVASGTEPSEIRALCRTFETSDAEGRRLLQLLTNAVVHGGSK